MPIAGLEPHPLAEAFPLWAEESFMNDIRDHGVRTPMVFYEGKILDGRNRVAAAKRAGQTKIKSRHPAPSLGHRMEIGTW
jgi:hypothetical protein